jgi:3,4-dihydroxy 2-butanone 4-phosphate synthase/GTP cyclohydrolase II
MFSPIDDILEDLRAGRIIVLVDDEQRENEGDLICAGRSVTPEIVNFMVNRGRGMLFVAVDGATCDRLDLPPQTAVNTTQKGTAYTVTVDAHARFGITTGVSADDRATTVKLLADPDAGPDDFARPGHIQPVRARAGGVLVRTGHTEGMVDLCQLAGLQPVALGIEVMNDDGTMARLPHLNEVCRRHHLKMCSVADVIAHRLERDRLVERIEQVPLDTGDGRFSLIAYASKVDALPHVALVCGRVGSQPTIDEPVLVRMHSQNLLGDVFGDLRSGSGHTLHRAMQMIQQAGEGAVVYLRQDGMGTGLLKQLQTMRPGEHAADEATARDLKRALTKFDFGVGSQILRDLGIRRIRLLTNHPRRLHSIEGFGLTIEQHVPIP